jgi:hypothetical protein
MDDDVVAFGPVGIVIEGQGRIGGFVIGPDDVHLHIGPGLDALAEDFLLLGVIMTAATGHQQGLKRSGICCLGDEGQWEQEGKEDVVEHGKKGGGENLAKIPISSRKVNDEARDGEDPYGERQT